MAMKHLESGWKPTWWPTFLKQKWGSLRKNPQVRSWSVNFLWC